MSARQLLKRSDALLVIIGPSGAGKSTAVRDLVSQGIIEVTPSWTTRPKRDSEEDQIDVEHKFVTDQEFENKDRAGFFLETVTLFGLPFRYGLPKIQKTIGKIPAVMLRAPLLPLLQKHYKNPIIYHIEAPIEQVKEQLGKRDQQTLGNRLAQYETECKAGRSVALRVFVNDGSPDELVDKLRAAITKDFV